VSLGIWSGEEVRYFRLCLSFQQPSSFCFGHSQLDEGFGVWKAQNGDNGRGSGRDKGKGNPRRRGRVICVSGGRQQLLAARRGG
jgi:hypothetical protein